MADAILRWNRYRVGGGCWSVEQVNPGMRDGERLYARPPVPPPPPPWVYRTMVFSIPEGGEVTLTFPEPISLASLEMAEELIQLQFRRLHRAAKAQIAAGDTEYASWLPQPRKDSPL